MVRSGAGVWRKEASLPKGDERDTELRGPGSVGLLGEMARNRKQHAEKSSKRARSHKQ